MPWDYDDDWVRVRAGDRPRLRDAEKCLSSCEATRRRPELARSIEDVARADRRELARARRAGARGRELMLTPIRYGSWITSGVGAFGLGLALIGLYGIVAFAVAQRRRDIAVHVAMGASPERRASTRAATRTAARHDRPCRRTRVVDGRSGVDLTRGFFRSRHWEPADFAGLAALLFAVSAAASLVPALAALSIAPMQVLRRE